MQIFITGGAGCLGSNIVSHLLKKDHKVCVLDNFETSSPEDLEVNENLDVIEGSITNYELVRSIFEKYEPNFIFHCAASYKDPHNPFNDINVNINATVNLIKESEKFNVRKFINFQTSLCYGSPYVLPIPINHYLNPKSSYGISKTAGELYLANSNLNFLSYRLASVLSPNLKVGVIPTFFKRLSEGKDCFCTKAVRDFIGLKDFLHLIDISLEDQYSNGIFNISSGEGISVKQIYDQIVDFLGIKQIKEPKILEVGKDDIETIILDPSITKKILGWEVSTSFNEDLKLILKAYQNEGLQEVYSHVLEPDNQ